MSKYVIINEANREKIEEAFKVKQGRARERMVDSFKDLVRITERVDERLDPMTKKAKAGTTFRYNFAQQFPNAYKYRPESTHFTCLFDKGAWRIDLDSIERWTCPNRGNRYMYELYLSESAKESILSRFE